MSSDPETEKGDAAQRVAAAARRALAEAEARRKKAEAARPREPGQRELGGRDGPEPVRYGDWEVKGIASDF